MLPKYTREMRLIGKARLCRHLRQRLIVVKKQGLGPVQAGSHLPLMRTGTRCRLKAWLNWEADMP